MCAGRGDPRMRKHLADIVGEALLNVVTVFVLSMIPAFA